MGKNNFGCWMLLVFSAFKFVLGTSIHLIAIACFTFLFFTGFSENGDLILRVQGCLEAIVHDIEKDVR